jgi:hypothetical protein
MIGTAGVLVFGDDGSLGQRALKSAQRDGEAIKDQTDRILPSA